MDYFKTYRSNSVAGSGNQLWFSSDGIQTGRVFYRIAQGGSYNYSLLFSNIIDSTFADGSRSRKNRICDEWKIHSARIGKCGRDSIPRLFFSAEAAARINGNVTDLIPLTFGERSEKTVAPGEFFTSDPLHLTFEAGEYLCLEMTVSGPMIPYHEESILPVFVKTQEGWVYSRTTPFAGMIGCDRPVKARIGYLGDSITQGIGVAHNSYRHWNALLSEKLGPDYACWNLGLGYGRADDMASDGAWLYKAGQNDAVILCAGVNDLCRGFTAEQILQNLNTVVDALLARKIRVAVQTVPPFDYDEVRTARWMQVNEFIRTELSKKVSLVFDTVPWLGEKDAPQKARYGGHPNEEGCAVWADALYNTIEKSNFLEENRND